MNPRVELIYDASCPNVDAARAALRDAFTRAGRVPIWTEWESKAGDCPPYARGFGSPTILVDGRDVAGAEPNDGADCCRVYADGDDGFRRAPSMGQIGAALSASERSAVIERGARSAWGGLLAVLPGIGASFLPVGFCPACWPAYAGVLSALGIGFLLDAHYLLPLTLLLLTSALISLAWRAPSRRGYRPLLVGAFGAGCVIAGKFAWSSDALLYLGALTLVLSSLWHSWPLRAATPGSCAACAPPSQARDQRAPTM
ncbi:MAG: MerC domain-containing protein [Deltaproteobacteria bacterium]|nr:MerC domain-containing protein [Deltaproteobacteria bacterium]